MRRKIEAAALPSDLRMHFDLTITGIHVHGSGTITGKLR
jgi:hypothetical protein